MGEAQPLRPAPMPTVAMLLTPFEQHLVEAFRGTILAYGRPRQPPELVLRIHGQDEDDKHALWSLLADQLPRLGLTVTRMPLPDLLLVQMPVAAVPAVAP